MLLKISTPYASHVNWNPHYADGSDEYEDSWKMRAPDLPYSWTVTSPPPQLTAGSLAEKLPPPLNSASFTPQRHLKSWSPLCILTNYSKCELSRPINKRFVSLCKAVRFVWALFPFFLSYSVSQAPEPGLPHQMEDPWDPNLAALQLALKLLQTAPAVLGDLTVCHRGC